MLLTVNAGSSSIRLAAYPYAEDTQGAVASFSGPALPEQAAPLLRQFAAKNDLEPLAAVAHRIVHGGPCLSRPCLVDEAVEKEIERLSPLAPLHNPVALLWLRACREVFPGVPQVAAFDTGFFAELPEVARTYALPRSLCEQFGIRRYGFHGLAHEAMWRRWQALHPERAATSRVITVQLGSGCSVAAVLGGKPQDTSMGFTPLEGLVMATRAGDVDPGILLFLQRAGNLSATELEEILNQHSGLLGVSGEAADMRILLASSSATTRLAIELYCYRVRKYLGAYAAVLGGMDGVVFGGGVGEHAPAIRAGILRSMQWAGIHLDEARNRTAVGGDALISPQGAPVEIWALAVNEAAILAASAREVLLELGHR